MKSIAQLISEGRTHAAEGVNGADLKWWMFRTWPDIEAKLRAAGELLEAVEAHGSLIQAAKNAYAIRDMAAGKDALYLAADDEANLVAAAQKLREASK